MGIPTVCYSAEKIRPFVRSYWVRRYSQPKKANIIDAVHILLTHSTTYSLDPRLFFLFPCNTKYSKYLVTSWLSNNVVTDFIQLSLIIFIIMIISVIITTPYWIVLRELEHFSEQCVRLDMYLEGFLRI